MKLGAYTITVDVVDAGGSKALPEYDVEMKGNEISCWIASEEGKTFKIAIKQDSGWTHYDTSARVFLDGDHQPLASRIFTSRMQPSPIIGHSVTDTQVAPFLFKSIVTTEEDTLDSSSVNDSFGSIRLQLHRGTMGRESTSAYQSIARSTHGSAFNELAVKKKKVTHVCGFSDSTIKLQGSNKRIEFGYVDAINKPLFIFIFKYRSKSLLQAMEIIPASPAPPSSQRNAAASSDIIEISSGDDSDDEAVRALQIALAKAKKDARAAKALRRTSKTELEDVKPKLERQDDGPVPHPAKRAKRESEVIELSD